MSCYKSDRCKYGDSCKDSLNLYESCLNYERKHPRKTYDKRLERAQAQAQAEKEIEPASEPVTAEKPLCQKANRCKNAKKCGQIPTDDWYSCFDADTITAHQSVKRHKQ